MPGLQTPPELGTHYQLALPPVSSVPLLPASHRVASACYPVSAFQMADSRAPFPSGLWASPGPPSQNAASLGQQPWNVLWLLLLRLPYVLPSQLLTSSCRCPQPGCALPVFSTPVCYTASASLTLRCHQQQIWWVILEFLKGELVKKEKSPPNPTHRLKMENLTMHRIRSQYTSTMNGLKIRQLNEGIINLVQIDIMSTTILVILILSLKKLFDISVNYETLIKSLERLMKLWKIFIHRV